MRLNNDEYMIQDGKAITITKEALLKWAEHYRKVALDDSNTISKFAFYFGKEEALLDILKHFDELCV